MSINMTKTSLDTLKKEAQLSLAKHNVHADGKGGIKVRLVLDHSGSMMPWYDCDAVQRLTEQVLGLASALDDDGTIEVWYFGSDVSKMYEVSLHQTIPAPRSSSRRWWPAREGNWNTADVDPFYMGWVDRTHRKQPWGSTNYADALEAPVAYQRKHEETDPALVIFQTDGSPDNPDRAREALKKLSGDKTFFSAVVFGKEEWSPGFKTHAAEFMSSLDTMTDRVRDNMSAFFVGKLEDYATLPDSALYDGVLGEFTTKWLPQVL